MTIANSLTFINLENGYIIVACEAKRLFDSNSGRLS